MLRLDGWIDCTGNEICRFTFLFAKAATIDTLMQNITQDATCSMQVLLVMTGSCVRYSVGTCRFE